MSGNTLKSLQNWILLTQSIYSSFRTFLYSHLVSIFIDFSFHSALSICLLANWCTQYNNSRYERFLDYWFAIQVELNDSRVDKNMPKNEKNVEWQNAKNQQFIVSVMFFNAANQHLVIFARVFAFHYIFIKTCNLTSICRFCYVHCGEWMYSRIQANYWKKHEHLLEK